MKLLLLIMFSLRMSADVKTLNLDNSFLDVKVENEFEKKVELWILVDAILKSGRVSNPEMYSNVSDVFLGTDLKNIPILLTLEKISLNDVFDVLKDSKIEVQVEVINRDLFIFEVSHEVVNVKISDIPDQVLTNAEFNGNVKNWFQRKGIQFSDGEDIRYFPSSKVMLVSASRRVIRLIESVLELESNISLKK